ncbi:hypothetical protein ABZZ17_14695 [Streptomyces sp. NPDC006512]|uniref:hypothetical protein n=1 Tax=Streptomyces sp. NPDC006512 TaxID=3154307 RepID=UPI0033B7B87F
MADLYALELALDLDAATPQWVLDLVARHLTPEPDGDAYADASDDWDEGPEGAYAVNVLQGRGPAYRVGGTCHADLTRTPDGWRLTARQEIHAEIRPDVEYFLAALAPHVPGPAGPVGSLRFYEDPDPEPIVLDAAGAIRLP